MPTALIETRTLSAQPTVVRRGTMTPAEMPAWFPETYRIVSEFLAKHGIEPAGNPFARYRMVDPNRFEVEAGFPVAAPVTPEGATEASSLPAGTVAVTTHIGPYDTLGTTYETIAEWLRLRGATPTGDAWEIYYDSPETDASTWRTDVVQPYLPEMDQS